MTELHAHAILVTMWIGVFLMRRNAAERAAEHRDRHEEAMLALRTLIERTAPANGAN